MSAHYRMDGVDYVTDSMDALIKLQKDLRKLSRGKAPAKSPGHYNHHSIVVGRDGNRWQTVHITCEDSFTTEWIQYTD